jgi:phosphoribosyl 1,2-cyclic phosphodiesterase
MICLTPLGSGSKGNATIISTAKTSILVDAGLTYFEIKERAARAGFPLECLSGIVVTHEHIDHSRSVAMLSQAYDIPVFAHTSVMHAVGEVSAFCPFTSNLGSMQFGDICVEPFAVPHDAAFTAGFRFFTQGDAVAIATDLGTITASIYDRLAECRTVLIESNHCENMLAKGRYPNHLKRRIMSDFGHLSNDAAADLCVRLASCGTKKVILAHLSEENNSPELVFTTVFRKLKQAGLQEGIDIEVQIAKP